MLYIEFQNNGKDLKCQIIHDFQHELISNGIVIALMLLKCLYRSENYSIIIIKVCLNFIIFNFYLSKRIPSTVLILSCLSLSPKHLPSCLPDLFDIFLNKFPIVAILINLDVFSSFILHWG